MQKINYVTNKDLLREIHKSKITYCYFEKPEYAYYDGIASSKGDVTPEFLQKVLEKKNKPKKIKGTIVAPNFTIDDIVIRVMTYEHIPLDPERKRKARKTDLPYARTNFPPFKHYIVRNGELVEVGRSHWKGDLETGHFDCDRGRISNDLASMFMMLVDRYSRRGNWRSYTYVDEMRSMALLQLSQVGLMFDESKGDNPFAFYTTTMKNCFTRILNIERKSQNFRDDMLIMAGATPSYTRQIENEMEFRFPSDAALPKVKRGAPKKRGAASSTNNENS